MAIFGPKNAFYCFSFIVAPAKCLYLSRSCFWLSKKSLTVCTALQNPSAYRVKARAKKSGAFARPGRRAYISAKSVINKDSLPAEALPLSV